MKIGKRIEMFHEFKMMFPTSSSSSSSYIFHGVGPLVDPFRSQISRTLFKRLPWFLLPFGEYYFITLCMCLTLILLTWRIWWAPNNANKWQMGFNSAFKGLKKICPASFRETCQWLKFPLNGLRAQGRVSAAVGLLPLASGLACLGWHFFRSWWNSYTAVTRASFHRLWEQDIPREGEDDYWVE